MAMFIIGNANDLKGSQMKTMLLVLDLNHVMSTFEMNGISSCSMQTLLITISDFPLKF